MAESTGTAVIIETSKWPDVTVHSLWILITVTWRPLLCIFVLSEPRRFFCSRHHRHVHHTLSTQDNTGVARGGLPPPPPPANDKKYQNCHHQIHFFQAQNAPNPFSDPAGRGAYDAPPDPSWLGRGIPRPHFPPSSIELGALVLRPPSTQNPGYASATRCTGINSSSHILKYKEDISWMPITSHLCT